MQGVTRYSKMLVPLVETGAGVLDAIHLSKSAWLSTVTIPACVIAEWPGPRRAARN